MGRVAKPKTLKAPPLTKVWVLERSPNMNKSIEISLMLGEYPEVIPSTNFVQPRVGSCCQKFMLDANGLID
jgi:hypothetical protein